MEEFVIFALFCVVLTGAVIFEVCRRLLYPTRRVSVRNIQNFVYHILIYDELEEIGCLRLPCQHLPWVLHWLPRMNRREPIELTVTAYDLSGSHSISIPGWAVRPLLRQLRKLHKTWSPKWPVAPPEGIYR